jgi:ABC-type branched-subunit amino acid transport system ATPase component/ABC-type branched-subunit amino acid transport system permease subunit
MRGIILKTAFVAALLVAPFVITSPYFIHLLATIAIFAVVAIGLDVVFGYTGEVSLGHSALFGIGAYTAAVLNFHFGIGFFWALPAGMIVAAGFGALLALPALRVTGPYLAMVTLAFGTIIAILINEMVPLTNGPLGIKLTRPLFFDWRPYADMLPFLHMPLPRMREAQFYFATIFGLLATLLVISRVLASRYGRAFEALRDSPIASDCMGVSVYKHKVLAFVTSAAFAGLAGVLFAYSEQYVAPNNITFDQSVTFLLAVTMGGRKSRVGPIVGAAIVVYLPNLLADIEQFRLAAAVIAVLAVGIGAIRLARGATDKLAVVVPVVLCVAFFGLSRVMTSITDYKLTIYGLMILFVVYYLPEGIYGFLRNLVGRFRPELVRPPIDIEGLGRAEDAWAATAPRSAPGQALLAASQIVMQFGGLKALDRVDLNVMPGTVHGLIGPNGSGKSTTMNVLTGIYTPTSGSVRFDGNDIAGKQPAEIAGAGIARTFQNVQLFGELTCLENIMVGLHHTYRGTMFGVGLGLPRARREEQLALARAASLLRFVGLEALANEEARNLPYGRQRLLEIARAMALDPKLLLLDEPAAGLTAPDIVELMDIIRKIRDHGITMILIEHHMDVVMGVCDTVTVLDFGQKIAEGKPAEVQEDERVIAAYLGTTHEIA